MIISKINLSSGFKSEKNISAIGVQRARLNGGKDRVSFARNFIPSQSGKFYGVEEFVQLNTKGVKISLKKVIDKTASDVNKRIVKRLKTSLENIFG